MALNINNINDMSGITIDKTHELVVLGGVTFALAITLLIGSWLAVGLRLWVRYRITKSPGRDDAAMVATLVWQPMPSVYFY